MVVLYLFSLATEFVPKDFDQQKLAKWLKNVSKIIRLPIIFLFNHSISKINFDLPCAFLSRSYGLEYRTLGKR